ncbi:MAG TPA: peptide chain release factor N(5)-glutamine methyltransferase [Acidimicrobiia bacterium]|nr:peptide chain release factor N(5)-glutamine methyltransferase [Acidimicrobiia bacterium]
MEDLLSLLPAHERRRLQAAEGDSQELARRRLEGEPLQYLEGTAAFTDFDVIVDPRVLIPRPETEGLFELAVRVAGDPRTIVDIGCGSGVLAIALARRFPRAEVHGVDISEEAISLARANAARLGVTVDLHVGDLFDPLAPRLRGAIDLLVSNPPYVSESEWADLPADVRREPQLALVAGPRGTEVLERIAAGAGGWMAPAGVVVCEMGETQSGEVGEAFAALGDAEIHLDLSGRRRYVSVRATP